MAKLLGVLLFSIALGGCGTFNTYSQLGAGQQKGSATESVRVDVDVVPRVGLFSHFDYVTDEGSNASTDAWSYGRYYGSVPSELRATLEPLPYLGLLTTSPSESGYRSRKVSIRITMSRPPLGCVINVPTASQGSASDNGCSWTGLVGNSEIPVNGSVHYMTDSGIRTSLPYVTSIPEDFLIVSLGDSFGSGEGNPDVPRGTSANLDTGELSRARWMDERCHRSMWAGPIRAGLEIIRKNPKGLQKEQASDGQSKQLSAFSSGSYTVMSLACSGATIAKGVADPYPGRISLESLYTSNPRVRAVLRHTFDKAEELEPQISSVKRLFEQQDKETAKHNIDALVLSVGGNDAYFAPLLESLVREDFTEKRDQEDLTSFLAKKLGTLTANGYPRIAGDLGTIKVSHGLITTYPDPTYQCADSNASNCLCWGPISGGLFGFIFTAANKLITEAEAKLARNQIVSQLNATVQKAADKNNWMLLQFGADGNPAGDFAAHGWCRERRYGSPYGSSDAWFRDVEESMDYQGDLFGTMHPSWQGHQAYQKIIANAISQGIEMELKPTIQNAWPTNDKVYFPRPLTICLSGPGSENTEIGNDLIRINGSAGTSKAISGRPGCLSVEQPVAGTVTLKVHHPITRRLFDFTLPGLVEDGDKPELNCTVTDGDGVAPVPCVRPNPWLNYRSPRVVAGAQDAGSGIDQITWTLVDPAGRPATGKGLQIPDLKEGRNHLTIHATDHVGNSNDLRVDIGVDETLPIVKSLQAYGHHFLQIRDPVALPAMDGTPLKLRLTAEDLPSGVARLVWSDGTSSNAPKGKADGVISDWIVNPGPPEKGSRPRIQTLSYRVQDLAGNFSAPYRLNSVIISDRTSAGPRRTATWQNQIFKKGNRSLLLAVRELTRGLATLPAKKDPIWSMFAAWLNLVDGRIDPDKPIKAAISNCSLTTQDQESVSAFSLLKSADDCIADRGRIDSIESLLTQLEQVLLDNSLIR